MDTVQSERSEADEYETQVRVPDGTEEEQFASVDELQNHGIGAADIQKLKVAGLCTIKVCMCVCCSLHGV